MHSHKGWFVVLEFPLRLMSQFYYDVVSPNSEYGNKRCFLNIVSSVKKIYVVLSEVNLRLNI